MIATNRKLSALEVFLQSPASYPDRPPRVEVKETHISRVYLTKRFAFKQKKPVRFDFLDFSNLPLRKKACQAELLLNRRLSPDVYLSVVPVCQEDNGKFRIGGTGVPVEWLVKMRRLDDSKTLSSLLRKGQVPTEQLTSLATRLAEFYTGRGGAGVAADEYIDALLNHIDSNRSELVRSVPEKEDDIEYACSLQTRYVNLLRGLFVARVAAGRVVDGHGDLRPDHIYFENLPLIIDCIEFNDEYRRNDIVDELAFLAMECDRLGDARVGNAVLQAYFAASGDWPVASLVAFFKSYRATVRAKVAALRGEQLDYSDRRGTILAGVNSYLQLIERYAPALGSKVVVIVGGLMGSGKSTLARQLARRLDAVVLRTDAMRNELYQRMASLGYGEGKYSLEARRRIYSRMFSRLQFCLLYSPTVVLDGTFATNELRDAAKAAADIAGAQVIYVECRCSKEKSLQRIAERQLKESFSEARPELYDRQATDYEQYDPAAQSITVDTTLPLAAQVEQISTIVENLIPAAVWSPARE